MDDSSTRDLVLGCCLVIAETLDDMCVESLFLSNVSSFTEPLLRTLLVLRMRQPTVRVQGYAEQVVPLYPLDDFRRHFRVQRSTFDNLIRFLSPNGLERLDRRGRPSLSCEKQLLITLWMLAAQETIRSVSDRFGVCEATVYRTVRRTIVAINVNWSSQLITAADRDVLNRTVDGFERRRGMKNVIGAIDGSHIAIKAPQEDYINRKGFHIIVLQGICNLELAFIDCFVGFPGSTHDARVLRRSDIYDRILDEHACVFLNDSF